MIPPYRSILFLDVDGVLNSGEYRGSERYHNAPDFPADLQWAHLLDPLAIAVLDDVVRQTDAAVVLSSAWRKFAPLSVLQRMLEIRGATKVQLIDRTPVRAELDGEYVGFSGVLGDRICPRGYEICQWLRKNGPVRSYAIVDDDDDMTSIHDERTREFGERFVQTDFACGLTTANGDDLVRILSTPLPPASLAARR